MIGILNRFCSKDDTRLSIATPWSRGEYSYATNGHILVRVSRLELVPERENAPAGDSLFDIPVPAEFFSLSDIILPEEEMVECSECNGDGVTSHQECSHCDGHECENCNGAGKTTKRITPIHIGNTYFQAAYLRILKDLPSCKIGPNANPMDRAAFTFDGGEGLLMPMKPFGEWEKV